jgi:hypothetical protein
MNCPHVAQRCSFNKVHQLRGKCHDPKNLQSLTYLTTSATLQFELLGRKLSSDHAYCMSC